VIRTAVVVDYGAGNLKSISKALRLMGLEVRVGLPRSAMDLLVLPGVGEFGSAMEQLRETGWTDRIREHVEVGRPLLGICLGCQIIFDRSEESPRSRGLGIIAGSVKKFNVRRGLPVPHMCWNTVSFRRVSDGRRRILQGLQPVEYVYFVHSYVPCPDDRRDVFGTTDYGGRFASMIVRDAVVATQFHLEKSGERGLRLLRNIVAYLGKV